jgi:hypothetical protein
MSGAYKAIPCVFEGAGAIPIACKQLRFERLDYDVDKVSVAAVLGVDQSTVHRDANASKSEETPRRGDANASKPVRIFLLIGVVFLISGCTGYTDQGEELYQRTGQPSMISAWRKQTDGAI